MCAAPPLLSPMMMRSNSHTMSTYKLLNELTGLRPQVIDKFIVRGGGDGIV